jgi:hypothetical protein
MVSRGMTQTLSGVIMMSARTRQIFDLIAPDAFDIRPILRHPLRFYEGIWPRSMLACCSRAAPRNDQQPIWLRFCTGIDPLDTCGDKLAIQRWPERGWWLITLRKWRTKWNAPSVEIDPLPPTAVDTKSAPGDVDVFSSSSAMRLKQTGQRAERAWADLSSASWIQIEAGTAQLGADLRRCRSVGTMSFPRCNDVAAFKLRRASQQRRLSGIRRCRRLSK